MFDTSGTSSSSSENEESNSDQSNFNEENDVLEDDEDDIYIEPPVFDNTKENDYKVQYKQSFEEVVSLDNVYILNLDAHKQ